MATRVYVAPESKTAVGTLFLLAESHPQVAAAATETAPLETF